ncbi:replication factor C subunit, putative [Entamoeba invadens IP1]|uniref:Replication factor C subunit, putative n=1 Tax=Entamoeba invadens IP1 TaxID=370355 RepID=A0A0A1U6M2_ENTIV|nr:replication factor C subunit, putative [Entamoeba invadens IP1]ELP90047.1 replication factor C subunit, putative [Entamoeba invadens IP1]|eukprot:XP_004256818.1 replication factor C subunit, putative [Entamoeba invadens IP1]
MFADRLTNFKQLTHAKDTNEFLNNLSKNSDMPHLLFHGPEGSGRYTRALLYLQNMFGPGVMKVECSTTTIDVKGKPQDLTIYSSPFHVELDPFDSTETDKVVVQEYIKSLTTFQTLTSVFKSQQKLSFAPNTDSPSLSKSPTNSITTNNSTSKPKFRVIMIHGADMLSQDAQQSLRRTMEIGSSVCRFILFCTNVCNIISPIRSRCVMVRVPAPNKAEMTTIVEKLGGDEKIVNISRGDIYIAEACAFMKRNCGVVENLSWKEKLAYTCQALVKGISSKEFEKKKDEIVETLTIINPNDVLQTLFICLMESKLDDKKKLQIMKIAKENSLRMQLGSEPIYHVETFFIQVAALFEKNK